MGCAPVRVAQVCGRCGVVVARLAACGLPLARVRTCRLSGLHTQAIEKCAKCVAAVCCAQYLHSYTCPAWIVQRLFIPSSFLPGPGHPQAVLQGRSERVHHVRRGLRPSGCSGSKGSAEACVMAAVVGPTCSKHTSAVLSHKCFFSPRGMHVSALPGPRPVRIPVLVAGCCVCTHASQARLGSAAGGTATAPVLSTSAITRPPPGPHYAIRTCPLCCAYTTCHACVPTPVPCCVLRRPAPAAATATATATATAVRPSTGSTSTPRWGACATA